MSAVVLNFGCRKDKFQETIGLCPKVTQTSPANGDSLVPLNQIITVKFNEKMNPATITQTTFTITEVSVVSGSISYSDSTATFTPSALLSPNTTFTGRVSTAVKDPQGNALQEDYVWSFKTGITSAPTVIVTDPFTNEANVILTKVITATFSEPMNPLTINSASFQLKLGALSIPGVVTYSGVTASFTPLSNLESGSVYTASVSTLATNIGGQCLQGTHSWNFTTVSPLGPVVVDLNSVARFGIIAGVGVSNNAGFSEIHNLDVGISPGVRSSITGFPPAIIVNGAMYASDDVAPPGTAAMLIQAKQDLTDAYLFAEGATFPAPATVSGDLGGQTLAPGIYKTNSSLLIQSGDLTLDGQGDVNASWIFQIGSDFTTVGGAGGNVILIGGAQAKNIFWQTGSSATIGDNTAFKGNVLALTSITMNSGAVAIGRMLARNGSVVMTSTNFIFKP